MLRTQFLILFLIFYIEHSSGSDRYLSRAVERTKDLIILMNQISGTTGEAVARALKKEGSPVATKFSKIQGEIKRISKQTKVEPSLLEKTIAELPNQILILQKQDEILLSASLIDRKYRQLLKYLEGIDLSDDFEPDWSFNFLRDCQKWLTDIREVIIPSTDAIPLDKWFFPLVADHACNVTQGQCNGIGEIAEHLTSIYRLVILSEMKGHIILAFLDRYKNPADIGWKREANGTNIGIEKHFMTYLKALASSLKAIQSSYFENCAQENPPGDESSFELYGMFQEFIFSYSGPDCARSCTSIWIDKPTTCPSALIKPGDGCTGKVMSCAWLGSVELCQSKRDSKYLWVRSSERGYLGLHLVCPALDAEKFNVPATPTYSISTCNCHCFDDRWMVYLGRMESRKSDNYVITGVRFIIQYWMLILQPAQGKLEESGYVSDFSWVPVPDNPSHFATMDLESRSFFFDDLQLDRGYVLTGIQFNFVKRGVRREVKGFAISISGVPFDYASGKLDLTPEREKIVSGSSTAVQKELSINPVNPKNEMIQYKRHSTQISPKEYTYVKIQQSSLESDFAQSSLPLFDRQSVLPKESLPLTGMGIFHAGTKDHAGFIALEVHSLNYLKFLDTCIQKLESKLTNSSYC